MNKINLYWIIIASIVVLIPIIWYVIKCIRNKHAKRIRIIAQYISTNLVRHNGITYPVNLSKMNFEEPVFTKYYSDFKEQIVISHIPEIGFVLSDDKSKPKFYYEDEIYLTDLNSQITGYLKDEVFYALHR